MFMLIGMFILFVLKSWITIEFCDCFVGESRGTSSVWFCVVFSKVLIFCLFSYFNPRGLSNTTIPLLLVAFFLIKSVCSPCPS